jgi:hypothetical protein
MSRGKTLSLYRSLLRECTYLPDTQARDYWWSHIASRFRKNRILPSKIYHDRLPKLFEDAQKTLTALQNANHGHEIPLQKILRHAYGRAGKRRHELLRPLLELGPTEIPSVSHWQFDEHPNQAVLPDIKSIRNLFIQRSREQKHPSPLRPFLPPRLQALIQSQVHASHPGFGPSTLRKSDLTIRLPKQNIWGRPLPEKRRANVIRDWYQSVQDRALPPLPDHEWQRIKSLATGERSFAGSKPRRPMRLHGPVNSSDTGQDLLSIASKSQTVQPVFSRPRMQSPHILTKRYMRRQWALIFAACSVMSWDANLNIWKVSFGSLELPVEAPRAGESEQVLFASHDQKHLAKPDHAELVAG